MGEDFEIQWVNFDWNVLLTLWLTLTIEIDLESFHFKIFMSKLKGWVSWNFEYLAKVPSVFSLRVLSSRGVIDWWKYLKKVGNFLQIWNRSTNSENVALNQNGRWFLFPIKVGQNEWKGVWLHLSMRSFSTLDSSKWFFDFQREIFR